MREDQRLMFIWIVVVFMLVLSASPATANMFSINELRSNQKFQGAEVGIAIGDVLYITGGLDAATFNFQANEYVNNDLFEVSASLIIPNGGFKLFFSESEDGVRPYLRGNVFRSFPSVSIKENGEEILTYDDKELINDLLTVTGGRAAFGVEYKINGNIGLTGETGMRFLYQSVEENDIIEGVRSQLQTTLGLTYTSLGLNFYF